MYMCISVYLFLSVYVLYVGVNMYVCLCMCACVYVSLCMYVCLIMSLYVSVYMCVTICQHCRCQRGRGVYSTLNVNTVDVTIIHIGHWSVLSIRFKRSYWSAQSMSTQSMCLHYTLAICQCCQYQYCWYGCGTSIRLSIYHIRSSLIINQYCLCQCNRWNYSILDQQQI